MSDTSAAADGSSRVLTLTAARFDEFWEAVFGHDWYIEDHDDESGTIDGVTEPDAVITLESTLDVGWQGGSALTGMPELRRRFTFLTERELGDSVHHRGRIDGLKVLRRWLNVNYPTVTGDGTVQLEVPAAIAGDVRALIDAYLAKNGAG